MTDPDLDPEPDAIEQANVAAAAIAGFTLAQFAFGELIKNGIVPRGDAEQLLRQAIEAHTTAGPVAEFPVEVLHPATRRICWPQRRTTFRSICEGEIRCF
jgi:hypothetical protein